MKNNDELEICTCGSPEHQMIFSFDPDDGWNDYMFITIHLSLGPWYKRIWPGIKYLFGYQSKYGHFDEIMLDKDGVQRIKDKFELALSKMPIKK